MAAPGVSHRSQFALPRGLKGRLVGGFLAVANARMDRFAIGLLELSGKDRILEIGFGPGVAIRLMGRREPGVTVSGIDPSDVMIHQASRRNRGAIRRGHVDLRRGAADSLPWHDASFDRLLALNNAHLWDPIGGALAECLRVLRPGGRIVLGFHIWRTRGPATGLLSSLDHVERFLTGHLEAAGFRMERKLRRAFLMGTASFLIASRP